MSYYFLSGKIQSKPTKLPESYAFSVGVIKALESKLIKSKEIKKLTEDSLPSVLVFIKNRYPSLVEPVTGTSLNQFLLEEKSKFYNLLVSILPEPFLITLLCLPHDFHNLKVNLKNHILNINNNNLFHLNMGFLPSGLMTKKTPNEYQSAFSNAYKTYLDTGSLQLAEMIIDKEYLSLSFKLASNSGSSVIFNYYKKYIIFKNLMILMRGKKWNLPFSFIEKGLFFEVMSIKALRQIWEGKEDIGTFLLKNGVFIEAKEHGESLQHIEMELEFNLWKYLYGLRFRSDIGMDTVFIYSKLWEEELNFIKLLILSKMANIASDRLKQRGLLIYE